MLVIIQFYYSGILACVVLGVIVRLKYNLTGESLKLFAARVADDMWKLFGFLHTLALQVIMEHLEVCSIATLYCHGLYRLHLNLNPSTCVYSCSLHFFYNKLCSYLIIGNSFSNS